jgi:hypothetical protein
MESIIPVTKENSPAKKHNMNQNSNNLRDSLAPLVAISALCFFAIFTVYMVNIASTEKENHWNRTLYVFGTVEAIAFAAAGFFFGSEVQRRTVEKAEERVQKVEELAEQAQDDANKGKALAAAVNSLSLSSTVDKATASGLSDNEAISIQQIQIEQIKNLARDILKS